jgi:hypothetical protein
MRRFMNDELERVLKEVGKALFAWMGREHPASWPR